MTRAELAAEVERATQETADRMRAWRLRYVSRDTNGTLRALTGRPITQSKREPGPDAPIVRLRERGWITSREETEYTADAFRRSREDR